MKPLYILALAVVFFTCKPKEIVVNTTSKDVIKNEIGKVLDSWHGHASDANFNAYFELMSSDAIFIGTDASENWNKEAFKLFAKPHFDKGKAWNFKALNRHIFVSDDKKTAWFDELLDTQMKLCRGSGVLEFGKSGWKISHYVLSLTIPNENVSEIIQIKQDSDSLFVKKMK